jgi:hypothetical protein
MAPVMFQSLAGRCQVPEDDYYLLLAQGVTAPEEFFFKIPNEAALESWIVGTLYLQTGTSDDHGNFASQPRNSTLSVEEFTRSDITAAVRRLWYISKEMANNDLKNMANQVSGQGMDSTRRKPSVPYINELRSQAASRGVTDKSDRDTEIAISLSLGPEIAISLSLWPKINDLKNMANQVSGQGMDSTRRKPSVPYIKDLRSQAASRGVTDKSDRDTEIAISLSLGPEIAISLSLGPKIAISILLGPLSRRGVHQPGRGGLRCRWHKWGSH